MSEEIITTHTPESNGEAAKTAVFSLPVDIANAMLEKVGVSEVPDAADLDEIRIVVCDSELLDPIDKKESITVAHSDIPPPSTVIDLPRYEEPQPYTHAGIEDLISQARIKMFKYVED